MQVGVRTNPHGTSNVPMYIGILLRDIFLRNRQKDAAARVCQSFLISHKYDLRERNVVLKEHNFFLCKIEQIIGHVSK